MKERWRRKDSGKEERKKFLKERGVQEGEEGVEYKELKERDKRRQEEKRKKWKNRGIINITRK